MNDSTPKPFETQLNFASLFKMLTEHLASWNVYVRKTDTSFDVVTLSDGDFQIVSSHKTDLEGFKAALEFIPDILFSSLTGKENDNE